MKKINCQILSKEKINKQYKYMKIYKYIPTSVHSYIKLMYFTPSAQDRKL